MINDIHPISISSASLLVDLHHPQPECIADDGDGACAHSGGGDDRGEQDAEEGVEHASRGSGPNRNQTPKATAAMIITAGTKYPDT